MSTYALVGATGSTGSAILRHLLRSPLPDVQINILVRSQSKLLGLFPTLLEQTKIKIELTEAPLSDSAAVQRCLSGANVIFSTVASNISVPGPTPGEDAAKAITGALSALRQSKGENYNPPTVLILSSASLNPHFYNQMPSFMHDFLMFALHYTYSDVAVGNQIYRSLSDPGSHNAGLLNPIFIEPGGLMDPDGTEETGYEISHDKATSVSYADLGAGMVEIATQKEQYSDKSVAVNGTGKFKMTPLVLVRYLLRGIWARIWG